MLNLPNNTILKNRKKRESMVAYLMLSPALIFFILFVGFPIIFSFILTFMSYDIISTPVFAGFKNLLHFFQDPNLPTIYFNTFKFAVFLVPMHMIVGMFLAYCVYRAGKKIQFLGRTIIYFPVIVTTTSVAIAWTYMYNTDLGVINYYLVKFFGVAIPWLTSSKWSIPAIVIFSLWKFVGTAFLYFFIGLQGVSDSVQEAAAIDGANNRQIFFHVMLPMMSPTVFFVLVTTIITSIQMFDEPFLITNGGPGNSSRTISMYIYEQAFRSYNMGYASTLSCSLFILVLIITLIQFALSNKWITYD